MTENRGPECTSKPTSSQEEGTARQGLDRRRFVGLVGASLAGQWLIDPASSAWSATATPPSGTALVPGYLRASHLAMTNESVIRDLSDPRIPLHDTLRRVIPEGIPLEFISSTGIGKVPLTFDEDCAILRVHGVLPPERFNLAANIEALHLEAEILPEPGMGPFNHYVWGFDTSPVENISGPTRFDVPLGKEAVLDLWTSFEWATRGERRRPRSLAIGKGAESVMTFGTRLTLEDRYGEPRLRPGVYCLPLSDKAQGAFPLVANRDWLVPDELPFLLFSVQPGVQS